MPPYLHFPRYMTLTVMARARTVARLGSRASAAHGRRAGRLWVWLVERGDESGSAAAAVVWAPSTRVERAPPRALMGKGFIGKIAATRPRRCGEDAILPARPFGTPSIGACVIRRFVNTHGRFARVTGFMDGDT